MAAKSFTSARKTRHFTTSARRSAAAFQNALDVVQHLAGLLPDVAQHGLVGGGIHGDLAGNEDEIAGAHGRGIGTARRGNAGRRDALDHELVSFRFQVTLGFNGRHAARAGGGDGLAVGAVLHVAGMEHARDVGARAAFGKDVAVGDRSRSGP